MIHRLEIENFYSVRDRQIIDLVVAANAPDSDGRFRPLFPGSSERVPVVAALFGPNASGKSTVLRAIAFLAWFAQSSFQQSPEAYLPLECFKDSESARRSTRLAVEFGGPMRLGEMPADEPGDFGAYRYELELLPENGRPRRVHSETLRQRPSGRRKWQRVFERRGEEVRAGNRFGLAGYHMLIDKVRDNASLISTLAQFDHRPSLALRMAASQIVSNIFVDRHEATDTDLFRFYGNMPGLIETLNREISRIDLGVRAMQIAVGADGPIAFFEHEGLERPLPWSLESHGTRSFIRYFPLLHVALANGGVAVLDELDIFIHPILLPEIVRWFHDARRNPKSAQLWMTCHTASLLESLVKEEVVLSEKDPGGRTRLYALQDVQAVRRSDNLYKKYLGGVYGAVPHVG